MSKIIISSRQNPLVKFVCGLTEKKKRAEAGAFRFDGVKLLCEILSTDAEIRYVICRENADGRVKIAVDAALEAGRISEEQVVTVTDEVFDKMSEERSPEGVITVAPFLCELHKREESMPSGKLLVAESLRDPGNLGTVIRSCYALGIDTLLLTDDCADIYNPKTIRAAMGAAFRLNTQTVALDRLPSVIKSLRESGRRVFAAALCEDSLDISTLELRSGDCFVIGNEGHGLSESTVSACDASVIRPMRADAESLNAAAAAAICIWETVRS